MNGVQNIDFWQYLQLRDCLPKAGAPESTCPLFTDIGSQIEHHCNRPHAVTSMYHYLVSEFSGVIEALKQHEKGI